LVLTFVKNIFSGLNSDLNSTSVRFFVNRIFEPVDKFVSVRNKIPISRYYFSNKNKSDRLLIFGID